MGKVFFIAFEYKVQIKYTSVGNSYVRCNRFPESRSPVGTTFRVPISNPFSLSRRISIFPPSAAPHEIKALSLERPSLVKSTPCTFM